MISLVKGDKAEGLHLACRSSDGAQQFYQRGDWSRF